MSQVMPAVKRKHEDSEAAVTDGDTGDVTKADDEPAQKRGRGRPRLPDHLKKPQKEKVPGRGRGRPRLPDNLKKTYKPVTADKPKKDGRGRPRGSTKVKRSVGRPPSEKTTAVTKVVKTTERAKPKKDGRGRPKGSVKVKKDGRGRPKGSVKQKKDGRGRPKGSFKKKAITKKVTSRGDGVKRGRGRPKKTQSDSPTKVSASEESSDSSEALNSE